MNLLDQDRAPQSVAFHGWMQGIVHERGIDCVDIHKEEILEEHLKGNAKPNITRFKGLGEMSPGVLKDTTLDRKKRTTLRVAVHQGDELMTDRTFSELMGKDASARFRLITEGAHEVDELDV